MCAFSSVNYADFVKHTVRVHKNDPRFRVYCEFGNCGFTSKKWNSYTVDVSKFDRDNVPVVNEDDSDIIEEDIEDGNHIGIMIHEPETETKMLLAHYLLKLESCHRMS